MISEFQNIEIADFNYTLPDERIAKYPLEQRDNSQLLVYRSGTIEDSCFNQIDRFLEPHSMLVFNNTKVIHARLHFKKESGGQIEVFCLEPHRPHDYALSLQSTMACSWICMVGNSKKWKEGKLFKQITVGDTDTILSVERIATHNNVHEIQFEWDSDRITFGEILGSIGELPIPPYLNRKTEERDLQTYQTIYSKIEGSVAAPTAGLHFTQDVFEKLSQKGVLLNELTLHVGAGTFQPVKSAKIGSHEMHTEFISVSRSLIEAVQNRKREVVAVGTTSVRTLESLYYLGVLVLENDLSFHVKQWMPYEKEYPYSLQESLQALIDYLDRSGQNYLIASTQIMIVPGFQFRIVRKIVTNFHQPQSTLLLLISAFVSGDWRMIYEHALQNNYRFLSYGDSSLLYGQLVSD